MKYYNLILVWNVLLILGTAWNSSALAAWGAQSMPNLEGLTLDEAEEKYGLGSGNKHSLILEVNSRSGSEKCELIAAAVCSKACPTAKILYQSPGLIPNNDGTNKVKVDIYYDVNELTIGEAVRCEE
ncbi:MAG: hypothetical protein D3909_03345 [Candidatus Electrothrix sp. ATG1]|nr:hypothetical protein [Candidatus Electrothrix sp. ATG1]